MNINKTSFSAVVKLPKDNYYNVEDFTVDVELDKDEEHLTYDEVVDAAYNELFYQLPVLKEEVDESDIDDDDAWPTIVDLVVNSPDGESYPVVSESMTDKIAVLDKDKSYTKYLVLPDARYSLTPECLLWMQLKEEGIIDEDAEFDFEKYHRMVEKQKSK